MFKPGRLLFVCAIQLVCGCVPGEAPSTWVPSPGDPALTATPGKSVPFDVGSVVRQVHFSFREEAGAFSGGDSAYAVRVDDRGGFEMKPFDRGEASSADEPPALRPTGRRATAKVVEGSPLRVRTVQVGVAPGLGQRPVEQRVDVDGSLVIDRGDVIERLRNNEDGVEQSWSFDERPAGDGDLVVRVAVTGQEFRGADDKGLHFVDPKQPIGMRYGMATWIDDTGERTRIVPRYQDGEILITVPADLVARSAYPALLDPLLLPETSVGTPLLSLGGNLQFEPAIGFVDTYYWVVWADNRSRFDSTVIGDIIGTRVTSAGTVQDVTGINFSAVPEATEFNPSIACDGFNCLIAWQDERPTSGADQDSIWGIMWGKTLNGPSFQITSHQSSSPKVAYNGVRYLVVWEDQSTQGNVVDTFAQRVTTAGALTGSAIVVQSNTNSQRYPAVAGDTINHNFLVVWSDAPSPFTNYDVLGRRVNDDGTMPGSSFAISNAALNQLTPAVAYNSSGTPEFLVAWADNRNSTSSDLFMARVRASDSVVLDGAAIGIQVAAATGYQAAPAVAASGLYFLLVWEDSRSGSYEIWGSRVTASTAVFNAPHMMATGGCRAPAVSLGTNPWAFVFTSDVEGFNSRIWMGRVTIDSDTVINTFKASDGRSEQTYPDVATNGTEYFVVWVDDRDLAATEGLNVYGSRVNSAGTVLSTAKLCNATGDQIRPDVTYNASAQRYVVVWEDKRPSTPGIYGQRVTAATGAIWDAAAGFAIATGTNGGLIPKVASSNTTNALVVWQRNGSGPTASIVNGATPGAIFVAGDGSGSEFQPDVAWNGTSYYVAWEDTRNSGVGSQSDIFGGRIGITGTLLDGTAGVAIATGTTSQYYTSVTSNTSDFLVSWVERTGTTGPWGVRAQRITSAGALTGSTITVAGTTTNERRYPQAAWDGTNYVIGWMDRSPVESIYVTRVSTTGALLSPTSQVGSSTPLSSEGFGIAAPSNGKSLLAFTRFDTSSNVNTVRAKARFYYDIPSGDPCYNNDPNSCASGFCVGGTCCYSGCSGANVASATCAGGNNCVFTCNSGFSDCDGTDANGCEINLNTNTSNCGGCNRACSATGVSSLVCSGGLCTSTCAAGLGNCTQPAFPTADNGCETNLNTNTSNCGGCGRVCDSTNVSSLVCSGGLCTSTCTAGSGNCTTPAFPTADNGCETNISANTSNCGACGRVCSSTNVASLACSGGICTSTCTAGFGNCGHPTTPTPDDGCEANLNTSTVHCGGCGRVCNSSNVASLACSGGLCTSTCNFGFGNCGTPAFPSADDGCEINTNTNTSNCGGCGRVCSSTGVSSLACSAGLCTSTCTAGLGNCTQPAFPTADNGCETNIITNTSNCGGCGRACSSTNVSVLTCASGLCTSTCTAGNGNCGTPTFPSADDGCESNLNTNTSNCGGCGRACSSSGVSVLSCSGGTCNSACTSGNGNCTQPTFPTADNGCETNINTSTSNCGGCGRACSSSGVSSLSCSAGLCNSSCTSGNGNCTQPTFPTADNGCETNINTSTSNCGGCGRACSSSGVSSLSCSAGLCNSSCTAGNGNCGTPAFPSADDGCEINTNTNTSNCGGCGRACSSSGVSSLSCSGGVCDSTCTSGSGNCGTPAFPSADDGCETNTNTNTSNCGGCGRACSSSGVSALSCSGGTCNSTCTAGSGNCTQPAFPTADNGCETNINTSTSNCGGCGRACSNTSVSSLSCSGGLCNSTCTSGNGNCTQPTFPTADNGCETNTNTSTSNCGGCGRVCSSTGVASLSCSSGTCNSTCTTGLGNCSQPTFPGADNGCETNTTLQGNCGGCGVTCGNTSCTTGACQLVAGNGSCAAINTAACATPFCQLGGGCGWADSDNDGLSDTWETNGYVDLNCNGSNEGSPTDLQLTGASSNVPDLFVYYNYMTAGHSHAPAQEALDYVSQAFLARGITLHWVDGGAIPESTVTTLQTSAVTACAGTSAVTMASLRTTYFNAPLRQAAFHYMVFAHRAETPDATHQLSCTTDSCGALPNPEGTGSADLPGDDSIVSFGPEIDTAQTVEPFLQATTIMHELGHNLGLKHGAADLCVGNKPNYISVMNPQTYQLDGIPVGPSPGVSDYRYCSSEADCGPPTVSTGPCATANACHCTTGQTAIIGFDYCYRVDFSNVSLPDLNELSTSPGVGGLDEAVGAGGPASDEDLVFYYVPGPAQSFGASNGVAIDWDNKNGIQSHVTADINNDGSNTLLTSWNDWQQIDMRFQCTGGFGLGSGGYWETSERSPPQAAADNSLYPPRLVTIDLRPGCGTNWIVLGSSQTVPVVLYGNASFDVSQVNQSTLRLAGATPTNVTTGDTNGDTLPDLTLTFVMSDLQIDQSTTSVTLSGGRSIGQSFTASDTITITDGSSPTLTIHDDGTGFAQSLIGDLDGTILPYTLADCVDTATDRCGNALAPNTAGNITKITSDETENNPPQMEILGSSSFQLMRQRNGGGDGRVYTVFFTITDSLGNATPSSCQLQVKHDAFEANAILGPPLDCVGDCP